MHASDVVLQAFVALLQDIDGLQDHVVTDEEKIAKDSDLPWAWINAGDENLTAETLSAKKTRELGVNVDLLARGRYQAVQTANDLAAKSEDRIDADRTLGGVVGNAVLQTITRETTDVAAHVRLIYLVTFWTRAGAASTPV